MWNSLISMQSVAKIYLAERKKEMSSGKYGQYRKIIIKCKYMKQYKNVMVKYKNTKNFLFEVFPVLKEIVKNKNRQI